MGTAETRSSARTNAGARGQLSGRVDIISTLRLSTVIQRRLRTFIASNGFRGKGALSVALVVTQHARHRKFPLNSSALVTKGGGQVLGLGRATVDAILKKHGINRRLAAEGGRTSRGSIGKMRAYVLLLNDLAAKEALDLDAIEAFWIERVKEFFSAKPFRVSPDPSKGLRTMIRNVIEQAATRSKNTKGDQYVGAVMQHLVGATLDCVLGPGAVVHHSFSTADQAGSRPGDFVIGDVSVHVTSSPTEQLIEKAVDNLKGALSVIVVTLERGTIVAAELAARKGISERIDILELEQFVALSLYTRCRFSPSARRRVIDELAHAYNKIVTATETDPSLQIEVR